MASGLNALDVNRNGWRIALWGGALVVLALPWALMQFDPDVAWTAWDFFLFGGMLVAACGLFELAARATGDRAYRLGAGVAVATGFLLVWMNLAVGIIGNEENPANLMYAGVIATALIGSAIARLRAAAMARAMIATALAQGLVAVAAQVAGHFTWILTAVFVALWLTAARLFRKAADQ